MSDHANTGDEQDSHDVTELPESGDATIESVESYETEDGVVFYDAQNPLAWLKAKRALELTEQA
jgi:hypothetical protein